MRVALGMAALLASLLVGIQAADATTAGTARIVTPDGGSLESGGSATPFSLMLPARAACPADTAHHGYLLYSYVLEEPSDPGHLTFPGGYPSRGVDLITTAGEPFVTAATVVDTGAVPKLPVVDWSRYDHHPEVLPLGMYNVGIACAINHGPVISYWNTRVRFVASSQDPGGFTWTASETRSSSGASAVPLILVVVALGLAGVVAGFAFRRRRTRSAVGPIID